MLPDDEDDNEKARRTKKVQRRRHGKVECRCSHMNVVTEGYERQL
jgi:hypothetical protein